MLNFFLCVFPNNVIYMNGKGKDISSGMKNSILKICNHLYDEGLIRLCDISYIEKGMKFPYYFDCIDRKDYVRFCVLPKIQRIFSILLHECRYENIYGLSSHSYLILVYLVLLLY